MKDVACPNTTVVQTAPQLFFHVKLSGPGPKGSGVSKGTLKLSRTALGAEAPWPFGYTLIGSLAVDVPLLGKMVQVPWTPVTGESVFVARWVSATDPMSTVESTVTSANVRNNNNIAWKAFTVMTPPN